ncbi:MAG: HlyD family efflux transporter periplasmic adaptor subunit [Planctomycetes bacterium]|nr:HlyD family efflux transporter periplasmic adaptor subunit [Planctomycetota bacterium]
MPTTRPSFSGSQQKNRIVRRLILLGLFVMLVVGGKFAYPAISRYLGGSTENLKYVTQEIIQGPFKITVNERGALLSSKNVTLKSRVEGTSEIVDIVPEGAQVNGPVRADFGGRIASIKDSGKNRVVTVQGDSQLIHLRGVFVFIPGTSREYHVEMGKFTKILVEQDSRIEKGDFVAGDVVCELKSQGLENEERSQQIAVTKADADVEKGRKNIEIQLNLNRSDIAAARLKLNLARLDLRKFQLGERVQQENEQKGLVLLAQQEYSQAVENYDFVLKLVKKGYKSLVELETVRRQKFKAQNSLAVAEEKLKLMQIFTFERALIEFKANAEEYAREVTRVKLTGLAAVAQYRAELKARDLTLSVESSKLKKYRDQLKACRLIAPQAGKVVYAKQQSRRSDPVIIEKNSTVRENQDIISLPDFEQMKVEVKIHESKIGSVRVGLMVKITIDAFPGRAFEGRVSKVPNVPVKGSWPNYDLMFYETDVTIIGDVTGLKPGMNAKVEIISNELDNVLQAPVQAIFPAGDKYGCYVLTADGPQLVKGIEVGLTNNKTVLIKKGLKKGQRVVMNPRSQFTEVIRELEPKKKVRKITRKPAPKKRPTPAQRFKDADKNNDGKLSRDEIGSRMASFFDKIDANSDGGVDQKEYSAALAKMRSGGQRRGSGQRGKRAGGRGPR